MNSPDDASLEFRGEVRARLAAVERQVRELNREKDLLAGEVRDDISKIRLSMSSMEQTLARAARAVDKSAEQREKEKDEFIAAVKAAASARRLSWSNVWPTIFAGVIVIVIGGLLMLAISGTHP